MIFPRNKHSLWRNCKNWDVHLVRCHPMSLFLWACSPRWKCSRSLFCFFVTLEKHKVMIQTKQNLGLQCHAHLPGSKCHSTKMGLTDFWIHMDRPVLSKYENLELLLRWCSSGAWQGTPCVFTQRCHCVQWGLHYPAQICTSCFAGADPTSTIGVD